MVLKRQKKQKAVSTSEAAEEEEVEEAEEPVVEEAKYVGCYVSEASFKDKVYDGGSTGANYNLALHHAKMNEKKYFAVARGGSDGHAFAFGELEPPTARSVTQGGGCERGCMDTQTKPCGCMDQDCTGPVPQGEEHNRRWAVYEVI